MLIGSLCWHSWRLALHPHRKAIHQPWRDCHPGPTAELAPLGLLRCDMPPVSEPLGGACVSASCWALEGSGNLA